MIPRTTRYNFISEASLKSSPKNVSMSLKRIMYRAILPQIYEQFCLEL